MLCSNSEKQANKNFRFTITTNVMLLIKKEITLIRICNVVLSLDGRKEVNDAVRKRVDGSGSYDRILPGAKKMVEERGEDQYYIRGTFTRRNLDFGKDVMHLADLGFEQISIEPVVAAKGSGLDIRTEDLEKVCNEYERLALEYVERRKNGKWFNFFHFMIDLKVGHALQSVCVDVARHEYLAVTPEGDLHPPSVCRA